MSKKSTGKSAMRAGIKVKILAMALGPLLILALVSTVFSARVIRQGMEEEAIKRLEDTADGAIQAMNAVDEGAFHMEGEALYKGEENISERLPYFDAFSEESGIDLTLFHGDVRRVTTLVDQGTGERMVGTQASEEVKSLVLEQGTTLTRMDLQLNGEPYFCCYKPVENPDGSIAGMIFAGEPSSGIRKFIVREILKVILMALVIIVLGGVLIIFFARGLSRVIQKEEAVLQKLSGGNLDISLDSRLQDRGDELGEIARAMGNLVSELSNTLSHLKQSSSELLHSGHSLDEMAERVNVNASEMGKAVEEISAGAASQAEEIEHASSQIMDMGAMIEQIVGAVDKLNATSITMKKAGDASSEIMRHLADSSNRTNEAIGKIGAQVYATNESAQKIREAVDFISSIASQTSLLSLNASIEAARAGEFGKGFAVVASEIQKLADESSSSAQTIADIIASLIAESDMTVKIMQEMEEIIAEQQEKLETTQNHFEDVAKGISQTREEAAMIEEQTKICDQSRKTVVDVIANLSAISQENAASAQETTASMEELNATIHLLAEAAESLKGLSDDMDEQMKFFKI